MNSIGTILTHPDEVSGTSVFSDGIKIFWTEGYSNCVVLYPDGKQETVDYYNSKHPMMVKEREFENSNNRDQRDMNRAELDEWELMRNCVGDYDSGQYEDQDPVPHIPYKKPS